MKTRILKIKIWVFTGPSGEKRYHNAWAMVKRKANKYYQVETLDGEYQSNTDTFHSEDRAFYTN